MSNRTILLAVGGASSSLQKMEDTIWQASRDAIARSGRTDVDYAEVNSAGASRLDISKCLADAMFCCRNLVAVLKSHGGDEFLDCLSSSVTDLDPHLQKSIPRLAVILCDVHSLNRRKLWWGPPPSRWNLWNRARYKVPTIKPEWRSIAVESHWTSISQFNRKPYGTRFEGADIDFDLTNRHRWIKPGTENSELQLYDHFNISYAPQFQEMLDHALRWTA